MPAYFETGFFVRQPAWHGLGEVVATPPPNARVALKRAELDWEVEKRRMFFYWQDEGIETPFFAIVRNSDGKLLGRCQENYEPLQNLDAMKWCEPLLDTELWTYETAGALYGGKTCWVLLKQDEVQIVPNDVLKQYLLFMWDHTGRRASTIRPVSIRVVCANTLSVALKEGGGVDRVWHNSKQWTKLEEIRKFYEETSIRFAEQRGVLQDLSEIKWDDNRLAEYVDSICKGEGEDDTPVDRKRREVLTEMVVDGKASGAGELGIKNTAYGALMAVTEYYEHFHGGKSIKDRGANILFGKANRAFQRAFDKTCELARVT